MFLSHCSSRNLYIQHNHARYANHSGHDAFPVQRTLLICNETVEADEHFRSIFCLGWKISPMPTYVTRCCSECGDVLGGVGGIVFGMASGYQSVFNNPRGMAASTSCWELIYCQEQLADFLWVFANTMDGGGGAAPDKTFSHFPSHDRRFFPQTGDSIWEGS